MSRFSNFVMLSLLLHINVNLNSIPALKKHISLKRRNQALNLLLRFIKSNALLKSADFSLMRFIENERLICRYHQILHLYLLVSILFQTLIEVGVFYCKVGAPLYASVAQFAIKKKHWTVIFNYNI